MGRGGEEGGNGNETNTWDMKYCTSSVSMAYVMGLKLHHSIISTLWNTGTGKK